MSKSRKTGTCSCWFPRLTPASMMSQRWKGWKVVQMLSLYVSLDLKLVFSSKLSFNLFSVNGFDQNLEISWNTSVLAVDVSPSPFPLFGASECVCSWFHRRQSMAFIAIQAPEPPESQWLLGGELPTARKWVSSPQWLMWINPTKVPFITGVN